VHFLKCTYAHLYACFSRDARHEISWLNEPNDSNKEVLSYPKQKNKWPCRKQTFARLLWDFKGSDGDKLTMKFSKKTGENATGDGITGAFNR
jgi:hypothetical protein